MGLFQAQTFVYDVKVICPLKEKQHRNAAAVKK